MVGYELSEALDDEDGVVVVEWAEKIEASLPEEKIIVKFRYVSDDEREIEFEAEGDNYKKILSNIL